MKRKINYDLDRGTGICVPCVDVSTRRGRAVAGRGVRWEVGGGKGGGGGCMRSSDRDGGRRGGERESGESRGERGQ